MRWLALSCLSLCLAMSFIDQSGIPLALPTLQLAFHSNIQTLNWVVSAYWLPITLFCLLAGVAADHFPKHLLLIGGLIIFAAASLWCAIANNIQQLILARFIQGVGAATLIPMTSALLPNIFSNNEFGKASGSLASCGALAAVFGPILVGALLTHAGWRWIFIINIPLSLIVISAVYWLIPKDHKPLVEKKSTPTKHRGLIVFIVMISSICLWTIQLPEWGILQPTQIILLISATFFSAVLIKLAQKNPQHFFIQPQVIRNKYYRLVTALGALTKMRSGISIYAIPFFFQIILQLNPLQTGFIMVPTFIAVMICGTIAGRLSDNYGAKLPFLIGTILSLLVWSSFLFINNIHITLLYVLCFFNGAANVMMIPVSISQGLKSTPRSLHGAASGLGTLSRQLCALIGVLMVTSFSNYILAAAPGTKKAAISQAILNPTKVIYALHTACAACLIIALVQALVLFRLHKQRPHPCDDKYNQPNDH